MHQIQVNYIIRNPAGNSTLSLSVCHVKLEGTCKGLELLEKLITPFKHLKICTNKFSASLVAVYGQKKVPVKAEQSVSDLIKADEKLQFIWWDPHSIQVNVIHRIEGCAERPIPWLMHQELTCSASARLFLKMIGRPLCEHDHAADFVRLFALDEKSAPIDLASSCVGTKTLIIADSRHQSQCMPVHLIFGDKEITHFVNDETIWQVFLQFTPTQVDCIPFFTVESQPPIQLTGLETFKSLNRAGSWQIRFKGNFTPFLICPEQPYRLMVPTHRVPLIKNELIYGPSEVVFEGFTVHIPADYEFIPFHSNDLNPHNGLWKHRDIEIKDTDHIILGHGRAIFNPNSGRKEWYMWHDDPFHQLIELPF